MALELAGPVITEGLEVGVLDDHARIASESNVWRPPPNSSIEAPNRFRVALRGRRPARDINLWHWHGIYLCFMTLVLWYNSVRLNLRCVCAVSLEW